MSTAGLLDAIGRHVQRAAATLLGPGDIEVGTVAAIRIAMTSAVRVAAAAGGLGQPALDHDTGGAKELAEERGLPTHIIILGILDSSVKKKSTLGHGIYSRKCENRGSKRCILRRKVASGKSLISPAIRHIHTDGRSSDFRYDFFSTHFDINYLPTTKPARRQFTRLSRKPVLTYIGAK
jgi:hypothetical protein